VTSRRLLRRQSPISRGIPGTGLVEKTAHRALQKAVCDRIASKCSKLWCAAAKRLYGAMTLLVRAPASTWNVIVCPSIGVRMQSGSLARNLVTFCGEATRPKVLIVADQQSLHRVPPWRRILCRLWVSKSPSILPRFGRSNDRFGPHTDRAAQSVDWALDDLGIQSSRKPLILGLR